ncbi:MAG: hypothetical protein ACRBDL_11585 [Alphaproteobacteria bacterium]
MTSVLRILIIYTLFLAGGILSLPQSVHAVQPLQYKEETKSPSLKLSLNSFLKNNGNFPLSDYLIADTDLNKDGIDEYILRRKGCSDRDHSCRHLVFAEKQDTVILLTAINAREIMIATTYSYGIKDIMAFNNSINEYNFDIYMWSPKEKTYILEASE